MEITLKATTITIYMNSIFQLFEYDQSDMLFRALVVWKYSIYTWYISNEWFANCKCDINKNIAGNVLATTA